MAVYSGYMCLSVKVSAFAIENKTRLRVGSRFRHNRAMLIPEKM